MYSDMGHDFLMKKIKSREKMETVNIKLSNLKFCYSLTSFSILCTIIFSIMGHYGDSEAAYAMTSILTITGSIASVILIIITIDAYFSYKDVFKKIIYDTKKEVINNVLFKKADRLLRVNKVNFTEFKSGHTFDSKNSRYIYSQLLNCGVNKNKIEMDVYYEDITINSFFNCLFCYENNQFELLELTPVTKERMAYVVKDNKEAFLRAFSKEQLIITT